LTIQNPDKAKERTTVPDTKHLLQGIRVIEAATMVFVPSAAAIMADFGAEVIKVEAPSRGDIHRYGHQLPGMPESQIPYVFQVDNRIKKSVVLNLKEKEGREVLRKLIASADVFLTNYRTGALKKLKMTYEDFQAINPRLIYGYGSGYGETGPEADKPGYDMVCYWSRSGIEAIRSLTNPSYSIMIPPYFLSRRGFMSLRSLYVLPFFIILTVVFSILALLMAFFDSSGNRSHRMASLWGSSVLFFSGVRVKTVNPDVFTPGEPYIFAANHQSAFDILALLGKLKVQFRWLAKESLFNIPVFGWAMRKTGYIPINRSNPKQAYQSLLQAAKKVNEGTSILIFPEGTRQETDHLGDFKKGGFILALKSQKPIVPVGIIGSAKVLPKNSYRITPGTIKIILGKPIPTAGIHTRDAEILMEKVREAIEENLKQ
jgi:1-acyl-sn-glycerol-3-phosphate acyltransferase